eukprot:2104926-Pyramimonas_sp.AAC.1
MHACMPMSIVGTPSHLSAKPLLGASSPSPASRAACGTVSSTSASWRAVATSRLMRAAGLCAK